MLDFTRLMLISTQVEVVVDVGVELGKKKDDLHNGGIKDIQYTCHMHTCAESLQARFAGDR